METENNSKWYRTISGQFYDNSRQFAEKTLKHLKNYPNFPKKIYICIYIYVILLAFHPNGCNLRLVSQEIKMKYDDIEKTGGFCSFLLIF